MNIFYNIELRSGTHKVGLYPDSSISEDYDFVLPGMAPQQGYFLVWNSTKGALEWSDTSSLNSPATDSNTFTVNNDLTGGDSPTENCSFIVNRGIESNALLNWNETTDKWEKGITGTLVSISGTYTTTFGNADLTANILTITHNLNGYPSVTIVDNNNIGIGMSPTYTSTNAFTIDFSKVGTLTGVWKLTAIL